MGLTKPEPPIRADIWPVPEKEQERCPGNPFPRGSEWGERIDREYRRKKARRMMHDILSLS